MKTSYQSLKVHVKRKGADEVHEEVRQRLVAVGAKLERYDNSTKQYRQNRLFESNLKRLFNEMEGVIPDAEEDVFGVIYRTKQ